MSSLKYFKPYRACVRFVNQHFPVIMAQMRFRKKFGRKINLKNPKDINEKILWLSLYSDISEWSRLSDKYVVRSYVEDLGLGDYLVQLYGRWDKAEDIEWDKLPSRFVLKTNNGSGTVKLVADKTKLDIPATINLLNKWLRKKMFLQQLSFIMIPLNLV